MGFLTQSVGFSSVLPLITSSAKKNLETLNDKLDDLNQVMHVLEYTPGFNEFPHKINEFRGKFSKIQETISKPLNYLNTYDDSKSLLISFKRIQSLDPNADLVTTAKAYGAAMSWLGKLIQKLPPPADAVGVLVEQMGTFFAQVVKNIGPRSHFHEGNNPGFNELLGNDLRP